MMEEDPLLMMIQNVWKENKCAMEKCKNWVVVRAAAAQRE